MSFESHQSTMPAREQRPRGSALLLAVVVLAGLAAALTACGSSSDTSSSKNVRVASWGGVVNPGGKPVPGGTLTIDQTDAPTALSPLEAGAGLTSALQVEAQIFDTLVQYLPGSIDPKPGLAKSWTVSPDGLTYTFNLRAAKFSDGTPVTSADVKYSLNQQRLPTAIYSSLYAPITKIDTPNPSTAVLHLSKMTPGLIYSLGFLAAAVLPSELIHSDGAKAYGRQPIGSGPFKIKRWQQGQKVELVKNENYWNEGQPYLDGVNFVATPSDNTRVLNVQSGTSDVSMGIPYSQVKRLKGLSDVSVLVPPSAAMTVIWMNNAVKPFQDTTVRQALAYATPTSAIKKVAFDGLAEIMNTAMPKLKYWNSDVKPYPYDLAKAKALMAKSPVPNGFSATLAVTGNDQTSNQIAQILQQSWGKIGVKLTIDRLDHGTLQANFGSMKYDMTLFLPAEFTSDIPVEDEFATLQFNSPPLNNLRTNYKNAEAASLAGRATSEEDPARKQDFAELQSVTMNDPQSIPLVRAPPTMAVRSSVRDFTYMLVNWFRLETVWMEK